MSGILQISFTQMFFPFPSTNYLVGDAKCVYGMVYGTSHVVGSKRRKRIMLLILLMKFWRISIHLEYFPRTSRFLDFYRLSGSLCFFKKTFSWSGDRSSSKLMKWDLVYLLNTLGTLICGFLLPGRHILFIITNSLRLTKILPPLQYWFLKICHLIKILLISEKKLCSVFKTFKFLYFYWSHDLPNLWGHEEY